MKWFAVLLFALVSDFPAPAVAQPKSPPPIRIERIGGPATIPDVPRDEVICFALYTTHDGVLKLSAQLYPLKESESRDVTLEFNRNGQWQAVATQAVDEDHWMTTFRLNDWDDGKAAPYRVSHPGGATFAGTVRKNPREKSEIVVAAFTGNSNTDRGPRADIVRNVQAQDPDLLFFSGDQSYDHRKHLAAWLLFGRQFGEIIKDRPTVTIPDDHDVGQANLWGAGGGVSKLPGGADGGYIMPPKYVKMVERAQTSHLPDPYDPKPIGQGIGVYYTSLNVGGIDFAIIEDRKFKTGPDGIVPKQGPRPDHINDPNYDPATVDLPETELLGPRQLKFLREWGQDWAGAEMKAVLSQTIFAGGAHIHGKNDARLLADLDSNGWPQSGRARAIREMRRCFAFHIAGDQHLATVIHHGLNQWEDGNWSFCVPSVVNYYGRWWWPLEEPLDRNDPNSGATRRLPFTGRFYDGFRNKLTMWAYANPTGDNDNAAGYGLIRFNKDNRTIVAECWPRHIDVTKDDAKQFPGWPVTIEQQDNYSRAAQGYLPTLRISGAEEPVVQVIDEALDEPVYTLRINGSEFKPKVFRRGAYTVRIGEGKAVQEFNGVNSVDGENPESLDVELATQ